MEPRQRVIATIELNRPDRAPILHAPLPAALIKYGEKLNEIFLKYPQDFGPSRFSIPKHEELSPSYRKGIHKDEWGTVWATVTDGIHGQVYDHPLKSWEDLDAYEFPPMQGYRQGSTIQDVSNLECRILKLREEGYFVMTGFNPGNFFERMQWVRGFKNLLIDFATKSRRLYEFADRLLDFSLRSIDFVLEAKPDAVNFGDDWGTQDRLMVKPSFWREFFKPRYKKMFDLIHDHGAYVYFHSDGYIIDIVRDLAEIGVDVLNPQFSCFRLEDLAEAAADRMCVSSDIDRQYIMPRGNPREVDAYVERVIELFSHAGQGGLFCRGEINHDVPLENVKAMYRAFKKFGRYR